MVNTRLSETAQMEAGPLPPTNCFSHKISSACLYAIIPGIGIEAEEERESIDGSRKSPSQDATPRASKLFDVDCGQA